MPYYFLQGGVQLMISKIVSMRKIIIVILISIFIFTGCTAGTGIDGLLLPPKLSKEQSEINQALIDKVGKNIKLKYPKSGDYRSAFVIANIDDEPTNEAIVFYEKTGMTTGESTIRMNILDQLNGKWVSVFDHSGVGTEVDRILLSRFNDDNQITIIVGYILLNQLEKTIKTYTYSDGKLGTIYSDNYSAMEIMDINKDSNNELVLITNSNNTNAAQNTTATPARILKAKILTRCADGFSVESESVLDELSVDFTGIVKGYVGVDTPALFLDSSMGDGTIQTQIIYSVDKIIRNPLKVSRDMMTKTSRPVGYASIDIDNDGVVEIPTLSPFPGYETLDKSQQICVTDWLVFEKYALAKKNSGYYNINEGYCFMLPSRWQGTVTVKEDSANDEVIFYKYDGELKEDMKELMRIKVMKHGTNSDQLLNGYSTILTKGQMEFMVKVSDDKKEPLVLTMSEIMFNFYVL